MIAYIPIGGLVRVRPEMRVKRTACTTSYPETKSSSRFPGERGIRRRARCERAKPLYLLISLTRARRVADCRDSNSARTYRNIHRFVD